MMRARCRLTFFVFTLLLCAAAAADWPQYRADAQHSGYSRDGLGNRLALEWRLQTAQPAPAWLGDDTRMDFDHACQTVVAEGVLLFGGSRDCGIHAHDAASGAHRWSFTTNGPVRFAPAVHEGRVYAVSDDGYLYCLSLAEGSLLWKRRGGPGEDLVLGNDRMISRWPARGGCAIADGVLYWAAGIWPTEGIFIYACDPATGEPLWLNDDSGGIEMDQPHGTARAKSGVSAQGYLTLAGDRLLVPTGRAVPAGFSPEDGKLLYFHLQKYRPDGGSELISAGSAFVNNGVMFDTASGEAVDYLKCSASAVTDEHVLFVRESTLHAVKLDALVVERQITGRKGEPETRKACGDPEWKLELPGARAVELIAAPGKAVIGLDDGTVLLVDTLKRDVTWNCAVEGRPLALTASDGRLYVSTDTGAIYCYGPGAAGAGSETLASETSEFGAVSPEMAQYAQKVLAAAGSIAARQAQLGGAEHAPWMGFANGFCADLGCGDGALACELAVRANLTVYAVDSDPAMVAQARQRAQEAGLYGSRITVLLGDPADSGLPNGFADLVVSGRSIASGQAPCESGEIRRILRPYGGLAHIGAREPTVKGVPENVGDWTHQYCTPANTACSADTVAQSPLELLWFRDSDQEMPSRHGRGHTPLFSGGRMFVEGMNGLRAVNAYNGRTLWEYPLPGIQKAFDQEHLVGTAATSSNFCTDGRHVYVHTPDTCLVIDAASGEKLREYPVPGGGVWGYIAVQDGILFGSVADQDHIVKWAFKESTMDEIYTQSKRFFALDAATGELKWTYEPQHSIRHNAIAIGDGKVFLVDMPLAEIDRIDYDPEQAKRRGEEPNADALVEPAELIALDFATGHELWRKSDDIYGTLLALSIEHDLLLMTQQHTRFKQPSETGGRMTAFRASTGDRVWDAPSDPQGKASRPIINGSVIYNEPGAWSLLTGERLDFNLERSYGCGIVAGSQHLLVYRSATFGYYDLIRDEGTINYGGFRPACWINCLPVGGLVLAPDATSRCTCSYLIKTTLALQPAGRG